MLLTNYAISQNKPYSFKIHSHNDYLQNVPFWKGYAAGASSLEVDVFLKGDSLYVAHSNVEIDSNRSLQKLYLDPLKKAVQLGISKPEKLQLLIDIKSEAYTTLDAVIKSLKNYPLIINNDAISITISGNRPKPSDYMNYPDFIQFDYQSLDVIADEATLNKIALVSLSFTSISEWNGKGRLTMRDMEKVTSTIKKAHALGKPFRFWATPDSKTTWKALVHLGADFINTDKPFECAQYLNNLTQREYENYFFSEVYLPTFASDGKVDKVKNVILMIGDGNGLSQISATALANNGDLSLTQLKNIGFLKTQSGDDFTTDSAGAGTALATGEKVPNRHIGMDAKGNSLPNITEILSEKGFLSGIITSDQITGATPSAFYAHQKDRGMTKEIWQDLLKSNLSVFVSSVDELSDKKNNVGNIEMLSILNEIALSEKEKIGYLFPDNSSKYNNPDPLSMAVKNVLSYMEHKKKSFFLVVEGAKIDSYGHANDIGGVIREGIAFDKAITESLKYADTHQNTLVIITADHETGGVALPQGNISKNKIEGDFTTDDHTGVFVPVFAYGPRSRTFQGVYENNELFAKILSVLDISALD